jgi:hypothetical protein
MYYVTGGEYVDTLFQTLMTGTNETYGPYDHYGTAFKVWRSRTQANVDNCHHRLFIKQSESERG